MTRDDLLDVLAPLVKQYVQGDREDGPYIVVRAPEGIIVLQRNNHGRHLLIRVNDAELVVA